MVTKLVVDLLKRRHRAYGARCFSRPNDQVIRFHQALDDQIFLIPGFYMRHEDLVRHKGFHITLLISKDMGLHLIAHIIVDHTPYRCIT